jgi:uncharacterized Zn finger protein
MTTDPYPQPSREWWAQRWVDVLESFGWTQRLARARTYAREGNVLNIDFDGSNVSARVQGTAPEPYEVTLSLDPFSEEQWGYVVESMAERAIFSAKLLAGEMPQNIEEVFTGNGLSLFPFNKFDIHSHCSCPDPKNPCKHIGAVYYLLGDRFSEDPFVLFQLRGRAQDQIIDALRQMRSAGADKEIVAATAGPTMTPLHLDRFWHYDDQLEPSLIVIVPPPSSVTVLDVLGTIPLKAENAAQQATTQAATKAAIDYLKTIYSEVSQQAVQTAMKAE